MWRSLVFIGLLLALAGCGASQPPATPEVDQAADPAVVECSEPRPQVCTMEYAPVCARLLAGGEQTYSSPCNACADDAVASHSPGACPEQ
ncbi:hypothetical protein [Kineobactrum salinum]|uniref:Kazal-like domain-containing protein n=1 Tax=Kineobactrum salinum TaxID=2708301 RepID=A0A6C0U4W9_9GAMM|nr:hypothetical protein [Kineobactrum salinum]QIB66027.1 hypothetical protein G3T16_11975 [Kineobactrum salinum]